MSKLDAPAFAQQFQACSPLLWSIAAGVTGRRSDAEDLVQDAAAIALTKLDEFDPSTSFPAWMGQIVRNVARNARRQSIRRKTDAADPAAFESQPAQSPVPLAPHVLTSSNPISDDPRTTHAFDDDVLHALDSLDELPRLCLLLRTLHDIPYRNLARILSVPEGTAMSHVHRARHLLRQRLANHPAAPRSLSRPVREGGAA